MDGILLALKRLCSKAATQRETHDRRRVLDALEGDCSKAIPKMMTLGRILPYCVPLRDEDLEAGLLGCKSFCAVAAHSRRMLSLTGAVLSKLSLVQPPWPWEDYR